MSTLDLDPSGPERALPVAEADQVRRANETGKRPVVFVHGLWVLPTSWDRWAQLFESEGYAAVKAGWPEDAETVEEARGLPQAMAGVKLGEVADHVQGVISGLKRKPAIVGHSFGGLLAQMLADRGLSAATVAIDPPGFRGVLP